MSDLHAQVRESRRWSIPNRAFGAAAVVAVLALIVGVSLLIPRGTPPGESQSPFAGEWFAQDYDGSTATAVFTISIDGVVEMAGADDYASVCAGGPSTMRGTGRLESDTVLVIPAPVYACDDGSLPQALSGAPLEELLRNSTYTLDPASDTLTDDQELIWHREGAEERGSAPAVTETMWPQTSLEEVREAQLLADAGDPDYTWQVDAVLASDDPRGYLLEPGQAEPEIIDRFLREVLGWEAYLFDTQQSSPQCCTSTSAIPNQRFLRCAPSRSNPLYPGETCAPTLDDLRYESVSLDLVQPDLRGPKGIWVVSRWSTLTIAQADPVVGEAQTTERLEEFLAARVAGRGAEGFVDVYTDWAVQEIPLLYATSSGAPYERFEFERVGPPTWPYGGYIEFDVRLFADGGATVVEQQISSHWDGGRDAGVEGALALEGMTLENGRPVPMPFAQFDGEVTYSSPSPWASDVGDSGLIDLTDPAVFWAECGQGTEPAGAAAFAQAVIADPDFEATAPVPARVGGFDAVSIDVALAPGATVCLAYRQDVHRWIHGLEPGERLRMYLVEVPEGMSMQTLAITIRAPESRFEKVIEQAQPIIDSIEFHPR